MYVEPGFLNFIASEGSVDSFLGYCWTGESIHMCTAPQPMFLLTKGGTYNPLANSEGGSCWSCRTKMVGT